MSPTVTATIAQWGKVDFTHRCITALRRSTHPGRIDIAVWDNASPGGPGAVADRPDVRLERSDTNLGFGPAHDRLADGVTTDYLLILNNDVIVSPTCVERLVATAEAVGPALVSPRFVDFDGRPIEAGAFVGDGGAAAQFARRGLPESLRHRPLDVDYASGACLLVPTALFHALDGFDDRFAPAYYEDVDLCFRARQRGARVVVEPGAVAFHREGTTAGTDTASGAKQFQVTHRERFAQRWAGELAGQPKPSQETMVAAVLRRRTDAPTVLWVAPRLPRPDVSAGELRILVMLDALRDAGVVPVVVAVSGEGRARTGPMLVDRGLDWFAPPEATRDGVEADGSDPSLRTLLRAVQPDVVVASWPKTAARVAADVRAEAPSARFVVDAVDLQFLRERREADTVGRPAPKRRVRRELATYAAADAVIVASPVERDELARAVPEAATFTYLCPYGPPQHPGPGVDARTGLVFVGNFRHRPNVDAVAWWVTDIAPALEARLGRPVPLTVVGMESTDRLRDLAAQHPDRLDLAGWVPDLATVFDCARASVVPLRFGAGTKGKVAAAMAHGVPVVTTSVGAEGLSDAMSAALAVADDAEAFADAVAALFDDARWARARAATLDATAEDWAVQEARGRELATFLAGLPASARSGARARRVVRRLRQRIVRRDRS